VLLLEKKAYPGKKILITGNGRCNLTNACALDSFITKYGTNGSFLRNVFSQFFRDDLLVFLQHYGVETSTEPNGQVFPASNNARDIARAFERYMADNNVRVQTDVSVTKILVENKRIAGVQTTDTTYPASAVVLATGGASHPQTGSTGDGYRMAAEAGHTIVRLRPALVPLVVSEIERAQSLQGTSLRKVRLTAFQCRAEDIDSSLTPSKDTGRGIAGKHPRLPVIESRTGDAIITHFGLSGPITLEMSLAIVDALEKGPVSVSIDLKPDVSEKELREQLQQEFDRFSKRSCQHIIKEFLPQKLVGPFVGMTGVPPEKWGSQVTSAERDFVVGLMKSFCFNIKAPYSIATAMLTAGGVSLKEIEPRTMTSRLVAGLYFCGEVMDIDAQTGGYNLQAAFSTGYVAGEHAAAYALTGH